MFYKIKHVNANSVDDFNQKIESYKNENYKEIFVSKKRQLPAGQTCVHLRKGFTCSRKAKIILKTLATLGLILLKSKEQRTEFKNVFTVTRNVKIFYKEDLSKRPSVTCALVSDSTVLDTVFGKVNSTIPDAAFGKAKWEEHFGDVGVEPPLPVNIREILNEPCPIWGGKKLDTHALVLIIKRITKVISGVSVTEPFTTHTLSKLVRYLPDGKAAAFKGHLDPNRGLMNDGGHINEWENIPVEESYWALVTKNPIPGSEGKTYEEQKALLEELNQRSNLSYHVPSLLEVSTAIFTTFASSGEYLFSEDLQPSFTRCQEGSGDLQAMVGAFKENALKLNYMPCHSKFYFLGIGAVQRF